MGYFKDISGYETQTLKVIRRLGVNKDHKSFYEILCKKCNNTFTAVGSNVKSGNTKQCKKCYYKEIGKNNVKDLIEKKFERLFVLERAGSVGNRARWKCLCDCGKIKYVTGVNLLSECTKSCGCLRKEVCIKNAVPMTPHDWTGDKNGKREVIRWIGKKSRNHSRIWECHCLMCNEVYQTTSWLLSHGHAHECNQRRAASMFLNSNRDWIQMKLSMYWADEKNHKAQSECQKQIWRDRRS